jgi:hypothetical protein
MLCFSIYRKIVNETAVVSRGEVRDNITQAIHSSSEAVQKHFCRTAHMR